VRRFVVRRSLVVGLVASVILVSSLIPLGGSGDPTLPAADKLLHGVGYAVLAATACWARREHTLEGSLVVVAAVACFGGVVELLQFPLPTRHTSLADAAANTVGAAIGTLCWVGYRRLVARESA
jgi:VanZ family protein